MNLEKKMELLPNQKKKSGRQIIETNCQSIKKYILALKFLARYFLVMEHIGHGYYLTSKKNTAKLPLHKKQKEL